MADVETTEEISPDVETVPCDRCDGTGELLYVNPSSIVLTGSGRRRRPGPLMHGEPSRYSMGCRCAPCRASWTAYRKAREGHRA